jgi:hypothetical protein
MIRPALENNSGKKVQVQILSVTLHGKSNENDVIAYKFRFIVNPLEQFTLLSYLKSYHN